MIVMMVMVMKMVPFAREMSCDEGKARLGAHFVLLFSLLFSPVLGGAFPLLSWAPGCKTGNELPLETSLPSLSSAGVPCRRHECPPGKEEMHVGPPTLYHGPH